MTSIDSTVGSPPRAARGVPRAPLHRERPARRSGPQGEEGRDGQGGRRRCTLAAATPHVRRPRARDHRASPGRIPRRPEGGGRRREGAGEGGRGEEAAYESATKAYEKAEKEYNAKMETYGARARSGSAPRRMRAKVANEARMESADEMGDDEFEAYVEDLARRGEEIARDVEAGKNDPGDRSAASEAYVRRGRRDAGGAERAAAARDVRDGGGDPSSGDGGTRGWWPRAARSPKAPEAPMSLTGPEGVLAPTRAPPPRD